MEQRYLIVIDEQPQKDRLHRICESLKNDGIELVYTEIDPSRCTKRQANGDVQFDMDVFSQTLKDVPFINHIDVFATDYNLIEGHLKGIDVIKLFYTIRPFYRKQMVIYSAQIETVINDILVDGNKTFDEQLVLLKLMTHNDIEYLKSEGEFESKFKRLIEKEPNITIDTRLADSMVAIDSDDICCALPSFDSMRLSDVANILLSKSDESVALRREITDHIMAYITNVKTYE